MQWIWFYTNLLKHDFNREERADFIRAKYVDKEFSGSTHEDEEKISKKIESAIYSNDLQLLVRCWAQGAKLGQTLQFNVILLFKKI